DERSVRKQFQAKLERRLLAGQARLGEAGCPPSRRREPLVAAPRDPAPRRDDTYGRRGEVGDQLPVLVEDLRADGHAHVDRLPGRSVLQRTAAGLAVPCFEPAPRTKCGEVAQVGIRNQDDVAAGAAVAAVRAALRDVLLPAEVQAAVAAATRLHADAGAVVEHAGLVAGAVDFDEAALAALTERDGSGASGEDRVVTADAGARARTELRAALAHEDHPGLHFLAGEDLHAEHLRVRVAPVARRAESLLVGH